MLIADPILNPLKSDFRSVQRQPAASLRTPEPLASYRRDRLVGLSPNEADQVLFAGMEARILDLERSISELRAEQSEW